MRIAAGATGALVLGEIVGEDLTIVPGALVTVGSTVGVWAPSVLAAAGLLAVGGLGWLLAGGAAFRWRLVTGIAFLALFVLAFWSGEVVSQRAFNDCIDRGEEVRLALTEYYQENGSYPGRLSDLGVELPCDRFLLPNILHFRSTGSEYQLFFYDWLVSHEANDRQSFIARK
jgi:hypothetical protein